MQITTENMGANQAAQRTDEQKQHIEMWCQALESGRYKQGRMHLRHAGRFCCMGVGCDVSNLSTWSGTSYDGTTLHLPDSVMKFYGMTFMNPVVIVGDEGPDAAVGFLNDTGYTFPEIAAAIRRTYLK